MIGILLILFTPIPPQLLDFLVLLNFGVALLILLVTFYTEKPLTFSTFPSLLLMTTLFRLALNISATRLILDDAHAGKVIDAVGSHVVGGNYIIGLVVFLILIVVQYVVVTNGAQRVAEVAARFILDSLPGKQMSIDADLNMGIIDQDQARNRRAELEKESNFYGAMDGASKFVKGDAIAGILIIMIDIIAGLTIGIAQRGMDWNEALHMYTLLTVGDGIVTQIPSLIIAVATGIIITRAATDARLANEITRQFSSHPKTMIIVGISFLGLAFVPGIPVIPLIVIVAGLFLVSWLSYRNNNNSEAPKNEGADQIIEESDDSIYELTEVKPFELRLGQSLGDFYKKYNDDFENRIDIIRKQFARSNGLVIPALTVVKSSDLIDNTYALRVNGANVGTGIIEPDHLLVINPEGGRISIEGQDTREPSYGLPAKWIHPNLRNQAKAHGYTLVEPLAVLSTHIQELCKEYGSEFITRTETEKMIDRKSESLGPIIEEIVPSILSFSDIQKVLQNLVKEKVPINDLNTIVEVLADYGRQEKNCDMLTEKVRQKLGAAICDVLQDDKGNINVMTISPQLERKMISSVSKDSTNIGLLPNELQALISHIATDCEKMLRSNLQPIILCATPLRRHLRDLLVRACPQIYILSSSEISSKTNIVLCSTVELENKT